jgi:alpha-ketoglutarate-dependent taurine dioxygenase
VREREREREREMEFSCKEFNVGKCKGQKVMDGETIPLVLQPPEEPNYKNDMESLLLALEKNKEWFKQMIIKNSGVLLRGFNVRNAEDFNDIVETVGSENVPYVGRAPRTNVHKRVYTANEGPLSETILFHHEMALMKGCPENVMFFCEVPPPEGGETPIVPSFRVAERMVEEFPEAIKEMEEKGLNYTYIILAQNTHSFIGGGWPTILGTSDPAEAMKRAKVEADIDMELLPNGSAEMIFANRPLTKVFDGRKGRKMWFNNLTLTNGLKITSVMMMDGTEIPEKLVKRCEEILEEESIEFKWEKGDILFLDNFAMLHGRRPSLPPRKVFVSLGK